MIDADLKQQVRDTILRNGYTIQEWNEIIIAADYLRKSLKWEGCDHDHYRCAKTAWSNLAKKMIGLELYARFCVKAVEGAETYRL